MKKRSSFAHELGTDRPGRTLLSIFVVAPVLYTLLWNYGATEVIEAVGGPDGNLNILDGALATWFLGAVAGVFRRGGFPA